MTRAIAGDAARADLAAIGDVLAQQRRVLEVDVVDLVLAEGANFLLRFAHSGLHHRGAPPSKSPVTSLAVADRDGVGCVMCLPERHAPSGTWLIRTEALRPRRRLGSPRGRCRR